MNGFYFQSTSVHQSLNTSGEGNGIITQISEGLTPSLPQPVIFPGESCTDMPANSLFSGPVTSLVNAVRFDENPFTGQCKKEDRKA